MMGAMVYFHGTAFGYVGGKCRCDECLLAWRSYKGHTESGPAIRCRKPGSVNLTGHLSADTWRAIWHGACDASGIGWRPRIHDTRHAYATHLVASGVSLNEVQHLMGHRNIDTTMKYLHRVEGMRSKASEAAGAFTMSRPEAPNGPSTREDT